MTPEVSFVTGPKVKLQTVTRQTLRTKAFRDKMASPAALQDWRNALKPLFLKRLSDAREILIRIDLGQPESSKSKLQTGTRQTLRTKAFRDKMESPEAFQDGRNQSKPLFLKRLSDARKTMVHIDLGQPESAKIKLQTRTRQTLRTKVFRDNLGDFKPSKCMDLLLWRRF